MSRRAVLLLAGALAGMLALLPRTALAACGLQDPGGCVDGAIYAFWYGLAALGWSLDRTLLLLAYQLEALRWWLVEVAFTSAYQVLVTLIDPLILPVAILAVLLGGLAVLLLPVLGRTSLVNLRHALVWVALAPMLLAVSGPLIVQLEQLRSTVGAALFEGVSTLAPGAIFGAAAGDMRAPAAIYPANPCGTGALARPNGGGLRLDDLAAAVLWADAEDIHCPERGGPGADVPDLFYEAGPDGPGYAVDQDVSLMDAGNDRAQAVRQIQRGVTRTFLGLIPSTLAVLDALVQLVFALCLIALWVGLPIGLVFVFFEATAVGVTSLFRRMLTVLQVSWSSSVLLGIVAACLLSAAELRNATAYTGFAIGGIAITTYILTVATDTLKGSIRTVSDTIAAGTGLSITQPVALAGAAAGAAVGAGAAVAAGGAGAALTAAAAYQQTGSARYAAAAAIGRIRPIAELGEVAATMGWVDDPDITGGLYAGQRSAHTGWRGTRLQLLADAQRADAAGRTPRDRAEERQIARELVRAERPTVISEVAALAHAGQAALTYVGSAQMADDLGRAGDLLPSMVRSGWEGVRRSWAGEPADAPSAQSDTGPAQPGLTLVQRLDERLRPGEHGRAMRLGDDRRISYSPPPQELPEGALVAPREHVRVARLLALGYTTVMRNDQTVAFWRAGSADAQPAPDARQAALAEAQRTLTKSGALVGDGARLSLAAARDVGAGPDAPPPHSPDPVPPAPTPSATPTVERPTSPPPQSERELAGPPADPAVRALEEQLGRDARRLQRITRAAVLAASDDRGDVGQRARRVARLEQRRRALAGQIAETQARITQAEGRARPTPTSAEDTIRTEE